MLKIEDVKKINLVDILSSNYGMQFKRTGGEYVCLSPFVEEANPSFFVRQAQDGHWLFKDFSSGYGGSLIDFILKKEGFSEVSQALDHIRKLLSGFVIEAHNQKESVSRPKAYDVMEIYLKIKANNPDISRKYLSNRGINASLIEELSTHGILLHNRYNGHSYCCFAVFNEEGGLCCLDNHQIDGPSKFVLGHKAVFSRDWDRFVGAERVFVSESIIDYLSIKTLYNDAIPGVALLGNIVNFSADLFKDAREIISALDADAGGVSGFLDLQEQFSGKEFKVLNFGSCKDANEYLQSEKTGNNSVHLTARDKLNLYKEFMVSTNKTELALRWGINRSYMYEIVKECEENILSGFSERRSGRKPKGTPSNLDEAMKRISALEDEKIHEAKEKERYYARSEFLKIRLKYSELEASELRGEKDEGQKKQIKKKKKKRR